MNAVESDRIGGQAAGRTVDCASDSLETLEVADAHRVTSGGSETGGATGSSDAHEVADAQKKSPDGPETTGTADCGQGTPESADSEAERAWRAVYEPAERAIVEEHERRVASRVRRQKERAEEQKRARGDLMEATEGFPIVWEREAWTSENMVAWAGGNPWILMHIVGTVRKEATRRIDRLRHAERRSMYYETENARRRALAAERRRIRKRTTTNPCPTREQILDGWLHRSDSHESTIRFGSLIMDLECHVDNSLVFDDDGAIVGRRGGVKRWLQENIPALYLRYTTVMRFKAAAQKLRQIAELRDPVPAAAIVDSPCESEESDDVRLRRGLDPAAGVSNDGDAREGMGFRNGRVVCGAEADISQMPFNGKDGVRLPCGRNHAGHAADADEGVADMGDTGLRCGRDRAGTSRDDFSRGNATENAHARAIWREVVAGIGGSPTALMARIDALLDPRLAAEEGGMLAEWRRKHVSEIAARTKLRGGRLAKWLRKADSKDSHRSA